MRGGRDVQRRVAVVDVVTNRSEEVRLGVRRLAPTRIAPVAHQEENGGTSASIGQPHAESSAPGRPPSRCAAVFATNTSCPSAGSVRDCAGDQSLRAPEDHLGVVFEVHVGRFDRSDLHQIGEPVRSHEARVSSPAPAAGGRAADRSGADVLLSRDFASYMRSSATAMRASAVVSCKRSTRRRPRHGSRSLLADRDRDLQAARRRSRDALGLGFGRRSGTAPGTRRRRCGRGRGGPDRASRIRRVASISRLSPAAWPWRSLIALKSSRSTNSTATPSISRGRSCRMASTVSRIVARFVQPVSPRRWSARCSSWLRSPTATVTSLMQPIAPLDDPAWSVSGRMLTSQTRSAVVRLVGRAQAHLQTVDLVTSEHRRHGGRDDHDRARRGPRTARSSSPRRRGR